MIRHKKKAFTLFEILLVISITVVLFGISLPVYNSSQYASELDNALKITVSTLRTAQFQAMSGLEDSEWGVRINSNQVILFKGTSYATRDTQADLIYTLPAGTVNTGINEIIFNKRTGNTNNIGNIGIGNLLKSKVIVINKYGVVSY